MSSFDPVVNVGSFTEALENAHALSICDRVDGASIQNFEAHNAKPGAVEPCVLTTSGDFTFDELAELDRQGLLGLQIIVDANWN